MSNKQVISASAMLLLSALFPLTAAHLTSSSETSALFTLDGDAYRWTGSWPSTSDGVSGSYIHANALFTDGILTPTMASSQAFFGYGAAANVFCDLEVLGDGSSYSFLDETDIDGWSGGSMPDGTWDDGGIGGACHTVDQYQIASYNTPGCDEDAFAFAEDLVSGGNVWIGAACDEITFLGDPLSSTSCMLNEAVSGASMTTFADCINNLASPPAITCGSDGIADVINFGTGGGSWSWGGVPFIAYYSYFCGPYSSASAVFTYDYVGLSGNDVTVVPATVGWIDSRDDGGYGWSPPPTLTLPDLDDLPGPEDLLPPPNECRDGSDNDGDGKVDEADDGCRIDVLGYADAYNPLDDGEAG